MKKKLISILLPVYNAEQYIVDAIDSVLKQTYLKSATIIQYTIKGRFMSR